MTTEPSHGGPEAEPRSRSLPSVNPIERRMSKFLREPPSTRTAASVIVTATASVVILSGILMRVVDAKEYPNVFVGMWWAIQTVTTVGYGDVTPQARAGRVVATVVMLEGIAFLAIITAAITSTFVARAQRERLEAEGKTHDDDEQRIHDRFDRLESQLDRLGERLDGLEGTLRRER